MTNIVIDTREVNAVPDILEKIQFKVETAVEYMEFADYYFPAQGIGIERKTTGDFLQSIQGRGDEKGGPKTKRLFEQLAGMCDAFEKVILLIERQWESSYDQVAYTINVSNILLNWKKVKVYASNSRQETIDYLTRVAVYSGPSHNYCLPTMARKSLTDEQVREVMLMCIKGIGPKAAKKIREAYPQYPDMVNASKEELDVKLKGVNHRVVDRLYSVFHGVKS
jgi:ERCC4-type nuclease